jgi:hypothetical protein
MMQKTILWMSALAFLPACGTDATEELEAPSLPPEDSMVLPKMPDPDSPGALVMGTELDRNVRFARTTVGLVTFTLRAGLLTPQIFFADALRGTPHRDGDDWVWNKSYPLLGYDSELRGNLSDGVLTVAMIVNGTLPRTEHVEDFVWFSGEHEAGSGTWHLFKPEGDVQIDIDWERNSATDKTVTFTNVTPSVDATGDSVTYDLDGTAATFTIHDAKDSTEAVAEFTVTWDTATGEGRFDHTTGTTCCWDDIDADLVNVEPCP